MYGKCAFKLADYIAGDVKALNLEGNKGIDVSDIVGRIEVVLGIG